MWLWSPLHYDTYLCGIPNQSPSLLSFSLTLTSPYVCWSTSKFTGKNIRSLELVDRRIPTTFLLEDPRGRPVFTPRAIHPPFCLLNTSHSSIKTCYNLRWSLLLPPLSSLALPPLPPPPNLVWVFVCWTSVEWEDRDICDVSNRRYGFLVNQILFRGWYLLSSWNGISWFAFRSLWRKWINCTLWVHNRTVSPKTQFSFFFLLHRVLSFRDWFVNSKMRICLIQFISIYSLFIFNAI